MKKTFLLMAALLVMGTTTFAGGRFDFALGPKVGYQTAKLSYQKDDIKAGFMNHFTVGAFARFEIGGFYVQPEALWFMTSNAFTLNTQVEADTIVGNVELPKGGKLDFTLNAMNIQVPVFFGYKYNVVKNVMAVRVQVGPTFNFVLPQKTLVNKAVGESTPTEFDEEIFDTKTIAFGMQGGLGIDLFNNITLDINYNYGITKMFGAGLINNTEWGRYINTENISNVHTNMFMVTIGYKLL